jgi:hypothetical protein
LWQRDQKKAVRFVGQPFLCYKYRCVWGAFDSVDFHFKLSRFVIAGLTRNPQLSKNNQEIAGHPELDSGPPMTFSIIKKYKSCNRQFVVGQARNDVLYYHATTRNAP